MFNENYFKNLQIQLGLIIWITQYINSPFIIFEKKTVICSGISCLINITYYHKHYSIVVQLRN